MIPSRSYVYKLYLYHKRGLGVNIVRRYCQIATNNFFPILIAKIVGKLVQLSPFSFFFSPFISCFLHEIRWSDEWRTSGPNGDHWQKVCSPSLPWNTNVMLVSSVTKMWCNPQGHCGLNQGRAKVTLGDVLKFTQNNLNCFEKVCNGTHHLRNPKKQFSHGKKKKCTTPSRTENFYRILVPTFLYTKCWVISAKFKIMFDNLVHSAQNVSVS